MIIIMIMIKIIIYDDTVTYQGSAGKSQKG